MTSPLDRPLARRDLLRLAALGAAGGALAAACGSGDDAGEPAVTSTAAPMMPTPAGEAAVQPVLLTQEFVAGADNRFAVGLLDARGQLVRDAAVHLRFFKIGADGVTGTLRGEGDMRFVELNVEGAHVHDSSTGEAVSEDSVAFYVANTPFDEPGRWGVEIAATPPSGAPAIVQVPFDVLAESRSPGIGAVPPASRNDTVADNPDTASLCSRDEICGLHDLVIADVLGNGRPLVVQFSTPAFCETRFCGPVLEVLLQQVPTYRDRIDFVHIEVWRDFQARVQREAVAEWALPGEPYTFFIAADGRVASRLEAIFSEEELKAALEALLAA